jgi:hypothetical protein
MRRLIPALYILGVGLLLAVFVGVYERWKEPPVSPGRLDRKGARRLQKHREQRVDLGEVVVEGPHITGWGEDGRPLWEAWADRIEISPGESSQPTAGIVRLIGAHGNYYEANKATSVFQAGVIQVEVKGRTKALRMSDQVTARWGARDVVLQSRSLYWDFTQKKITGKEGIQFARGQWRLSGREILADLSMRRVKITGGARLECLG